VSVDISGLDKVISNLVNNALRYTKEGGNVNIESFILGNCFGFKVSDNGIGIEKNDLNKIFEEFFRGKNAKEMERFGTGLGLNMVKEIVEYYNGEISVKSTPGMGSTFTVLFPLPEIKIPKGVPEDELVLTSE
jgi:two-component system, OmpR family, phosphate regulon sensor histidine kinase PhoR